MTATMFEIDTDIDLIMHLDFNESQPCCGKRAGQPCPDETKFIGTLSCCGYRDWYCEYHRDFIEALYDVMSFTHDGAPGACGNTIERIIWEPK